MQNPILRLFRPRRRAARRDRLHDPRRERGKDCLGACGECGCDLFLLAPLVLLLRVVPGAFAGSAVDPYVARPASLGARVLARLIRSYQLHVSVPRGRAVCSMTPTCSRYGLQALSRHGLLRGGALVARRLRRCGRVTGGERLDPVPTRP